MLKKIFYVNGNINVVALLIFILIPLIVGLLSGYLSIMQNGEFEYIQPDFAPPDIVFPIVWTILYILMGIASYRIWMNRKSLNYSNRALGLYFTQLFFNFFWSIIFFRFGQIEVAFIWLIILLILVILTTREFFKIDKIAGWFMIPYIIWLVFAGILNYSILQLN